MHTQHTPAIPRLLCLLAMLALLAAVPQAALADEPGVVVGGSLHLRAEPTLQATVLATYPSGTQLTILATQDGWRHVYVDGQMGYMEAKYVSAVTDGLVDNQGRYVNLRGKPSRDAEILGHYPSGTALAILGDAGMGWSLVEVEGQRGYMAADLIHALSGSSAQTISPDDAALKAGTMGEAPVVHQVGRTESRLLVDDALSYTIYYPALDVSPADSAITGWIDRLILNAEALARGGDVPVQTDIATQHDSYRMDERYISVMLLGFVDSTYFAHPFEPVFALNVDLQTQALLTYEDIFTLARLNDVLEIVRRSLLATDEDLLEGLAMDETWLVYSLLTPQGVCVVLPRSEYLASVWGTQSVLIPYETLRENGLLALDVQAQTEAAATPQPQEEPPAEASGAPAIDPSRPMIALTFDDGPSEYTPHILDVLAEHGARATFCMVGNRISAYRDVVARVAGEGHEIATHTWSHKRLTTLSQSEIESQLRRCMDAITTASGASVAVMRPPYGAVNADVKAVCRKLGLTIATWSIDTEDWRTNNADATYSAIMNHVTNGSIILCHDVKPSTSAAMDRVIPALVSQGYQLVTVSQLLSFSKTGGAPGVVYNHLDTNGLDQ